MSVMPNRKLLVIILIIVASLIMIRESNLQQIYKEHHVHENTSVIRIETLSNYPDAIVPIGNPVRLTLRLTNFGPSESPRLLIHFHLCKPPECKAEDIDSEANIPETYSIVISNLGRGQSETTQKDVYGFRVNDIGFYRVFYDLEQVRPPSRCGLYLDDCQSSLQIKNGNKKFYDFQAVSLDEYNTYLINKNIQKLTLIIVILTIVTIATGLLQLFKEELKTKFGKLLRKRK